MLKLPLSLGVGLVLIVCSDRTTSCLNVFHIESAAVSKKPLELNGIANDRSALREKRAAAILQLFAMYLKPGDDGKHFRSIFKETKWVRESKIRRITMSTGSLPFEWGPNTFRLDLFPEKKRMPGDSSWFIFFRLSGGVGYVYGEELKPAIHFLEGHLDSEETIIIDFALCEYTGDDLFPRITHPRSKKSEVKKEKEKGDSEKEQRKREKERGDSVN